MKNDPLFTDEFLLKLKGIIENHISDDQFGVAELAEKVGMSRSNLLRKVKKLCDLSVSQFISQVRLQKAMELLQDGKLTVTEVGYEVGFGSTSYFIKCFREHYGYPPGDVGKKTETKPSPPSKKTINPKLLIGILLVIVAVLAAFFIVTKPEKKPPVSAEKSIAVLPFINDSNDSSNVYIINGLMESILNNLQKIENMRVISRTSVEKFRDTKKSIPEIARELGVNYFVEGSGQKVGNKIVLSVQLIDAENDKHLWAEQFNREVEDIFEIQNTIAKTIATEVQVILTPEEEQKIERVLTQNLEAYDHYLKGMEYIRNETPDGLEQSIPWFKKAIALDKEFADAYAYIAIAYYYLDMFQADKQYLVEMNEYADKAMLYNPVIPESLIAKGLFYMSSGEYDKALPHFEKALKYSPNSAWIINFLSDFYTTYQPNTQKYLEYTLKGERLNVAIYDSATTSFLYLHLSNSLVQNGFSEQALHFIDKSLAYNPDNISAYHVRAFLMYSIHQNLEETRDLLLQTLAMDTTRLDVMQDVGKVYYMLEDYVNAYKYYKRFDDTRLNNNIDIYWYENAKIAYVLEQFGDTARAKELYAIYKTRAFKDESIYKDILISSIYIMDGDLDTAIDYLKSFAEEDNYFYWLILFYKLDPLSKDMLQHPEFDKVWKKIEKKFWKNHDEVEAVLKEARLL